jgi:hypothetical protein
MTAAPYLLLNVVQRIRGVNRKADQDDVRVGVGKRSEPVVVFLTSRIPEGEFHVLAIDLNIGHVVLEDGRHIDLESESVSDRKCKSSGVLSAAILEPSKPSKLPALIRYRTGTCGARFTDLREGALGEDTALDSSVSSSLEETRSRPYRSPRNSHQQAGFATGTIADDDELATDFGHLDAQRRSAWGSSKMKGSCDGMYANPIEERGRSRPTITSSRCWSSSSPQGEKTEPRAASSKRRLEQKEATYDS